MSKVIALIDLDTPVYKAAAAVEERGIIVTHSPTGVQKSFSTRTEFKDLLKSKDKIDKLSEYEIEDTETITGPPVAVDTDRGIQRFQIGLKSSITFRPILKS